MATAVTDFDTETPATIEPKPQAPIKPTLTVKKLLDGQIMLFNANCFDVLPHIVANTVNMIFADLPYGTTACAWDTPLDLDLLWRYLLRVGVYDANFVFTASMPFTITLGASNLAMLKYDWIWQKNAGSNFAQTKRQPMKEHEHVLVFYTHLGTYNMQLQSRSENGQKMIKANISSKASIGDDVYAGANKGYMNGQRPITLRVPSSVQKFNRQRGKHPTQKPVELLEYLIKTYTNPGDLVLDPTMGSGTTAVACKHLGRRCIGIDLDKTYFDIAIDRVINE